MWRSHVSKTLTVEECIAECTALVSIVRIVITLSQNAWQCGFLAYVIPLEFYVQRRVTTDSRSVSPEDFENERSNFFELGKGVRFKTVSKTAASSLKLL